ncbi:MAG: hypothetical protein IT158_30620, partial [Bryobacterales bacterium]|nr:hypothetical protein [Bryobacterales bacterium]
ALSGHLLKVEYKQDPVFGFAVPKTCDGVPKDILDPINTWGNRDDYYRRYDALAARFIENFKLMLGETPNHVADYGPKRLTTFPLKAR